MGLIKAAIAAGKSTMADQWKEFFYCDAISSDILVVKGQKRIGGRSSNTKGSDNVISNGSGIAVADGQCMIIVEQGKLSRSHRNRENIPLIRQQSQASSPEILVKAFRQALRRSQNDLCMAVIPEPIRESTTSIP